MEIPPRWLRLIRGTYFQPTEVRVWEKASLFGGRLNEVWLCDNGVYQTCFFLERPGKRDVYLSNFRELINFIRLEIATIEKRQKQKYTKLAKKYHFLEGLLKKI